MSIPQEQQEISVTRSDFVSHQNQYKTLYYEEFKPFLNEINDPSMKDKSFIKIITKDLVLLDQKLWKYNPHNQRYQKLELIKDYFGFDNQFITDCIPTQSGFICKKETGVWDCDWSFIQEYIKDGIHHYENQIINLIPVMDHTRIESLENENLFVYYQNGIVYCVIKKRESFQTISTWRSSKPFPLELPKLISFEMCPSYKNIRFVGLDENYNLHIGLLSENPYFNHHDDKPMRITNYIQIESKDLPISLSINQTKNIKLLINDYYFGYLINHDLFLMLHRHDHYEDIESKKQFYCENCGHVCSFCSKSTKETKKYLFGSSVISNDKVHSIIFSTYFIIVNQNNGESRIYIKMNPVLIEDKVYIAS